MRGKIFNAQEVQAILAGNKTMFREVIKGNPISRVDLITGASSYDLSEAPYQVGQMIFVRETYKNIYIRGIRGAWFKASTSEKTAKSEKWLPPMALPQHLSRLTLQIKEIRVERLGSISEEDCWKEGIEELADYQDSATVFKLAKELGECGEDPRPNFAAYWNATHKKPEEKFEASPFVFVYDFEVVK